MQYPNNIDAIKISEQIEDIMHIYDGNEILEKNLPASVNKYLLDKTNKYLCKQQQELFNKTEMIFSIAWSMLLEEMICARLIDQLPCIKYIIAYFFH